MFGKRYDGVKVKGLTITEKAGPFFMPDRIGAQQYITSTVRCEPIDKFIKEQRALGKDYTYTDVLMASLVRLLYLRPKLNRFIMRNVVYEHKNIELCMVVKQKLIEEAEEFQLKFKFDGTETIEEVRQILNDTIESNIKKDASEHNTNKAASILNKLPAWMFRFATGLLRWLDNRNMFTKLISETSCFHCSGFVTNLKSIKLDKIYHHLYNFGTCSLFVAMGKIKVAPYVKDYETVVAEKVFDLGITIDERVADGLYFSKTLRVWNDIFAHPECLLEKQTSKKTLKKPRKKTKAEKKAIREEKKRVREERKLKKNAKKEDKIKQKEEN